LHEVWQSDAIPNCGSSAFVVLRNKEKAVRAGLVRQRTPTQCVRDVFLRETSFNAVLYWFLG